MRWTILLAAFLLIASSASAASCMEQVSAKDVSSFIEEVSAIDFSSCDSVLPSSLGTFFGDEIIIFKFFMQGGTAKEISVMIKDAEIIDIQKGAVSNPSISIGLGDCEFETLLRNNLPASGFAYLYSDKKLIMGGVGVWNSMRLGVAKLFIGPAADKLKEDLGEIRCSSISGTAISRGKAGAICQDGSDCESGNCIYVSGQGAERAYRCSCDPFRLVIEDPCRTSHPEQTTLKKVGETCSNGGECETGNCIYTAGQGTGRVYKCSCDPFKFITTGC